MNRRDQDRKINDILSDRTTFKEFKLNEDIYKLALKKEDTVNRILNQLRDRNIITPQQYNNMFSSSTGPGICMVLQKSTTLALLSVLYQLSTTPQPTNLPNFQLNYQNLTPQIYTQLTTLMNFRNGSLPYSIPIPPVQCQLVFTLPVSLPIFPSTKRLKSFATLFSRILKTFMKWTAPPSKTYYRYRAVTHFSYSTDVHSLKQMELQWAAL